MMVPPDIMSVLLFSKCLERLSIKELSQDMIQWIYDDDDTDDTDDTKVYYHDVVRDQ